MGITPRRTLLLAVLSILLPSLAAAVRAGETQESPGATTPLNARGNPVAEVEALERELMKIYSNDVAHHVDKVMQYFYDGPQMLQFDLMSPREFDGTDFRKHFTELAGQYNGVVELIDMRTHADNHIAFVSSLQHTYGNDPVGKPFDMTFRVTDCLVKVAGKWKILHEHVSFPIDLATGKADSQSKK
jgi:ketosteroid isomerase-like protein